jgi:hypothetical protein
MPIIIEEEDPKNIKEVNPDILESVFEESVIEEDTVFVIEEDDDEDIDIAFLANDEGYW